MIEFLQVDSFKGVFLYCFVFVVFLWLAAGFCITFYNTFKHSNENSFLRRFVRTYNEVTEDGRALFAFVAYFFPRYYFALCTAIELIMFFGASQFYTTRLLIHVFILLTFIPLISRYIIAYIGKSYFFIRKIAYLSGYSILFFEPVFGEDGLPHTRRLLLFITAISFIDLCLYLVPVIFRYIQISFPVTLNLKKKSSSFQKRFKDISTIKDVKLLDIIELPPLNWKRSNFAFKLCRYKQYYFKKITKRAEWLFLNNYSNWCNFHPVLFATEYGIKDLNLGDMDLALIESFVSMFKSWEYSNIPQSRLIISKRNIVVVQEYIEGETLWDMFIRSNKKKGLIVSKSSITLTREGLTTKWVDEHEGLRSAVGEFAFETSHYVTDWNLKNFIYNLTEKKLWYVDSKPKNLCVQNEGINRMNRELFIKYVSGKLI